MRLHVERMNASSTLCASLHSAAGTASALRASLSRRPTGAVLWLTPTATTCTVPVSPRGGDHAAPAPRLAYDTSLRDCATLGVLRRLISVLLRRRCHPERSASARSRGIYCEVLVARLA